MDKMTNCCVCVIQNLKRFTDFGKESWLTTPFLCESALIHISVHVTVI